MNKILFALAITLISVTTSQSLHADTIELINGKKFEGTFSGRDGDTIKFNADGIIMTFQAKDVKNIAMGASTKSANSKKTDKPAEKKNKTPVSIAAGTTITIRLSDTLNSGKHATGHKFGAVLEGALVSNGVTVAAAGSKVYGVISEAVKARRLAGNAKIMVTITDINIKGQITPITTSAINALTESTARGTAGTVVKGAAIGALIDGSSGARDGAKVGLGIAVLKGGKQVVIPSGTLLDFKLTKALQTK